MGLNQSIHKYEKYLKNPSLIPQRVVLAEPKREQKKLAVQTPKQMQSAPTSYAKSTTATTIVFDEDDDDPLDAIFNRDRTSPAKHAQPPTQNSDSNNSISNASVPSQAVQQPVNLLGSLNFSNPPIQQQPQPLPNVAAFPSIQPQQPTLPAYTPFPVQQLQPSQSQPALLQPSFIPSSHGVQGSFLQPAPFTMLSPQMQLPQQQVQPPMVQQYPQQQVIQPFQQLFWESDLAVAIHCFLGFRSLWIGY